MVASPEICRLNGSKSRGPRSQRGKVISSLNATKHGVLSQKPPVLITEDLEYFQEILQALMDEYNPKGVVETLLTKQIAMAWIRLNRLWNIEIATGNLEILKTQKENEFPDVNLRALDPYTEKILESVPKSHKKFLEEEIFKLKNLMEKLQEVMSDSPCSSHDYDDWFSSIYLILESLINKDEKQLDQNSVFIKFRQDNSEIIQKLVINIRDFQKSYSFCTENLIPNKIKEGLVNLYSSAEQSFQKLNSRKQELMSLDLAITETRQSSIGLVSPDLFARYERHITRQLNDAVDRLVKLQDQRKNGGCMGSFSKDINPRPIEQFIS